MDRSLYTDEISLHEVKYDKTPNPLTPQLFASYWNLYSVASIELTTPHERELGQSALVPLLFGMKVIAGILSFEVERAEMTSRHRGGWGIGGRQRERQRGWGIWGVETAGSRDDDMWAELGPLGEKDDRALVKRWCGLYPHTTPQIDQAIRDKLYTTESLQ